jgi:hypothetical protein
MPKHTFCSDCFRSNADGDAHADSQYCHNCTIPKDKTFPSFYVKQYPVKDADHKQPTHVKDSDPKKPTQPLIPRAERYAAILTLKRERATELNAIISWCESELLKLGDF